MAIPSMSSSSSSSFPYNPPFMVDTSHHDCMLRLKAIRALNPSASASASSSYSYSSSAAFNSHSKQSSVRIRDCRFSEITQRRPFICCATGSDNSNDQSSSSPISIWDIESLQKVASRIGDPLREMLSIANKRLQAYFDGSRKENLEQKEASDVEDEHVEMVLEMDDEEEQWSWERWQKYFTALEEQEKALSIVKFELESAVCEEDFKEAARLKAILNEATVKDPVSEVFTELTKALSTEHYEEAQRLRDKAAAGLVGWWVGLSEGESDPYGRIINISPSYGKLIAKGYTARQLANSAPGNPLFEIFIRKDSNGYHQQAVYLQQGIAKESAPASASSVDGKINDNANVMNVNVLTEDGKGVMAKDLTKAFRDDKKKSEDPSDDGLNIIINFLKDRLPDVKLKVFRVTTPNGEDIPKIVEKLLEQVETQENKGAKSQIEPLESLDEVEQELNNKAGNDGEFIQEVKKETPMRLIVGGMLQNAVARKLPKVSTRVPARIEFRSKDSFLLHIEENAALMQDRESLASLKVAALMTPSLSDSQSDTSEASSNRDKIPVKVSREMSELLKLAVNQVQKRYVLSKCTSFERIKFLDSEADPLTGLYIGSFGPFTSEIVQLRRKFGHWHRESDISNYKEKLEFFEYVEAVKLTGDLNVPAGQVTFRAKIGKDCKLSHRGIYPEELGVIARYKGQGMLAEPGFMNPQWVDGELLLFDGKGLGHLNGAEIGFVYSVPDRHFLVLFNRLKLKAQK